MTCIIYLMSRAFANSPGDLGSIPGRVIPKTQKMVLAAALLNTQHYKVRIKDKLEQSREWRSTLPYTLVWLLLKKEVSGHPRLRSPTLLSILPDRSSSSCIAQSAGAVEYTDCTSAEG